MASTQATKSRKRIQTTTICSDWTGSASVTAACPDNAGMAQHDLKVACAPVVTDTGGCVLAWLRPVDCGYYVRLGYLRLDVGEMVFKGLFDAMRLDVATPWSAPVVVDATISSIGTTYNSSASEGDETHWRRRYLHTNITSSLTGTTTATKQVIDHAPMSQHMLSAGGGVGTLQAFGSLNNDPFVLLGSLDAGGGFIIFTGYYDRIMVVPNMSSGTANVDLHSIAQELIVDDVDLPAGSPMITQDGNVDLIPFDRQMLWSVSGETVGNGSLDISGALVEVV